MWRIKLIIFISGLAIISSNAAASTNIDINSDVYGLLQKLEAEGLVQSGLLATKPLSRQEVVRLILEAESNAEDKSPFIRNLVKSLKERFKDDLENEEFIKLVEDPYAQFIYSDSDHSDRLSYNNDGYNYEKDLNFRFGLSSNGDFHQLSFHIDPEIRFSGSDSVLLANKAYGTFSFSKLDIEFGKDSQWWGPGHHGSILLSNNTEPMTILKLSNPQPVFLPSVLKYLGLFKFVFFATKLENDRAVSNPSLWGMRINFKPNPYIELGINRTALLGGEGRPENLKTWAKSFLGKDENIAETGGTGDQRGGIDLKLTIPFRWQPFQLYAEIAGEDEANFLPSKEAYLGGVYLPRILNMERLDFRFEYTTTHVGRQPNVWYNHSIYKSGYTYKGKIIGHHTGTDSEDFFLQLQYLFTESGSGQISVSYDREKHNLSGEINEISDEFTLEFNLTLKNAIDIKTFYRTGKITNPDNIDGANRKINILVSSIIYKF